MCQRESIRKVKNREIWQHGDFAGAVSLEGEGRSQSSGWVEWGLRGKQVEIVSVDSL